MGKFQDLTPNSPDNIIKVGRGDTHLLIKGKLAFAAVFAVLGYAFFHKLWTLWV